MLIHSYIYYRLDTNIVSDHQWQRWADELTTLQKDLCEDLDFYDREFKDWDGSTGFHLPHDEYVSSKANRLLYLNKKLKK